MRLTSLSSRQLAESSTKAISSFLPDTFVIGVSILGFFGILTPSEILSGFANEQIAVLILLLLLGDIIRQTAVIEVIFDNISRGAKTRRGYFSRMIIIIGLFSSFLNNTPFVAVISPYNNNICL